MISWLSHCFAQTEALMNGRSIDDVRSSLTAAGLLSEQIEALAPHRVFGGNRPRRSFSTGYAVFTGSIGCGVRAVNFVQGVLWNVFSFDQWGVELGKVLAKKILPTLSSSDVLDAFDTSTRALISRFRASNGQD